MGDGGVNKQIESDRQAAMTQQNQLLAQAEAPTVEQQQFDAGSTAWNTWLNGKDFSKGPTGTLLNFDLSAPAHQQDLESKMDNITGTGADALGGDDSIALQLSKQKEARQASQDAGQSYQNAVAGTDAYYKNSALPYMQAENSKYGNLFSTESGNVNNLTNAYVSSRPPDIMGELIGGGLGAFGSIFGGAFGKGGAYGGG